MSDNVIFLAERNQKLDVEGIGFLACSNCNNKNLTVVYSSTGGFPRLKCGACGCDCGKIGFANDEDE